MDLGQRIRIKADFDNSVKVDTIYLAVGSLTDYLAAPNGDHAIGLAYLYHW